MTTQNSQTKIRPTAVAGTFYPENKTQLKQSVQAFLNSAPASTNKTAPKAIIAPHAGYPYSAPIAAAAYNLLKPSADTIKRIIILGPAHRVAFTGIATTDVDQFQTPLANVPVDQTAVQLALQNPGMHIINQAHQSEHSIEVHLPFLIEILGQTNNIANFTIVPLLFSDCSHKMVADVLEKLWGHDETLILISSDLSHYHDYDSAQSLDNTTKIAIEQLAPHDITPNHACGSTAIQGLLDVAATLNLKPTTLDMRNSGDTAGSRDQVVGYGAWSFE